MEKGEQNYLRGDGKLPVIYVESENLAEATYKSIIACHDYGARVETPKSKEGETLGYDADMIIRVNNPSHPLKIYYPGIHDDARGLVQYVLEVTHGIHNHWKKSEEHPDRWGYTYNERFVNQLPFIFDRIKREWNKKGRLASRQYQFGIWRDGEDIISEQLDPPCLQRGHLRFLTDSKGSPVLNYISDWRSRDLFKAWNENDLGQLRLMELLANKVSDIIGKEVKLGTYIDRSSSLHLYGYYFDRDGLEKKIERMKNTPYQELSCSLEDYFNNTAGKTIDYLKRVVAAQSDAEKMGHGLNLSESRLKQLGYDTSTFLYPEDWDTWPKEWDAEPDVSKLARVVDNDFIDKEICRRLKIIQGSQKYSRGEKVSGKRESYFGDKSHIMGE